MKSDIAKQLTQKICEARKKGYISPLLYRISDVDCFAVPKVIDENGEVQDICTIYNRISSGLNTATWVPHFFMPSPNKALRQLQLGTKIGDFNYGKFF